MAWSIVRIYGRSVGVEGGVSIEGRTMIDDVCIIDGRICRTNLSVFKTIELLLEVLFEVLEKFEEVDELTPVVVLDVGVVLVEFDPVMVLDGGEDI